MAKTLDQLLEEGRFTSTMKRALRNLFNFAKPNLSYVANISVDITPVTPPTLVIGKTYAIEELEAGDDFTNVGYLTPYGLFVAIATTPTVWANNTQVYEVILDVQIINNDLDEDLEVSFDYENNQLVFTSEKDIFVDGKVHMQIPSNTHWELEDVNNITIDNFPTLGLKDSIKIDVYN